MHIIKREAIGLTEKRLRKNLDLVYYILWVVLMGCSIFEVPSIILWAPIILFAVFLVYRLTTGQPFELPLVGTLSLLAFVVVYVLAYTNPDYSMFSWSYMHFHAVLMFLMGYNFSRSDESLQEKFKKLESLFLIVALMYMVYVTITYGNYLLHPENAPALERHYWSVWYPGVVIKASTGFSASLLFAVVWGAFTLFFSEKWYKKCFAVLLIAYALAFNIATGTRLLVYLTPVILVAEFFVWIIFQKKKYAVGIGVTVALVALLGAAVAYAVVNKDRLTTQFNGSIINRFFTMGFGSPLRWSYLKHVWENFSVTYEGGGVNSLTFGTPHNMWFYIYDWGGFKSFVLFCVFTLVTAVYFIRFLANRHVPTNVKFFIATLFGTVFVEFMVEDLILPLPSYYMLSFFTIGLFAGLSAYRPEGVEKRARRKKEPEENEAA